MNIPSKSYISISSSPRQLYYAESPHMETRDGRIDDDDMFLEKFQIRHDRMVKAKSALSEEYTYDSLSSCAPSISRPTNSCSEGEDDDELTSPLVLRQLPTSCQHQQRKRETQKTLQTSEQVQNILTGNIGTASCFDSFLRACDAIVRAIVEEVDINDNENDKCIRGSSDSGPRQTIGEKVVRFDLSRNTLFLF